MANVNDLLPSKYLKPYDLKGTSPIVTIARVELEVMGRTRDRLPVLYFVGKAKGLKLNRTIADVLTQLAGSPDTDHWAGTRVQLYATTADFGKQTYDVVRVKAASAAPVVVPRKQGVA
jgi:hypothetical protein